ncbi:hypothetical protein [Bacillus thuringiensis]|uniref:hypothetical protein n=1 Tax=Bacillus thuringiensis TaxID=1428 RepID=UPI0007E34187|nr:hypothetical protein [Bacillus thuringiensis]PGH96159.1 hypothetical protein CN898_17610 [Bacillus thuringiensis]PGR96161.1 hypothetical protein COC68_15855 [Bacillus thuringiensis]
MSYFLRAPISGDSNQDGVAGVTGVSNKFNGVLGISTANGHAGVAGVCDTSQGNGVYGRSKLVNGVVGYSSANGHSGVAGVNEEGNGNGIYGLSSKSDGVLGISKGNGKAGVAGVNEEGDGNGVYGRSKKGNGVVGYSSSNIHAGVAGANDNSAGVGVYGKGGRLAGMFEGNVQVTGDIILSNADCAEDFDIFEADTIEPGTVMIFGNEDSLQQSQYAYDKRVVGVISGAGNYKPGIILDKQQSRMNRKPVALMGKVYCKVDASDAPIEVGDLLTTSDTPGHAMKANDPFKAFGAVIGKAMQPLKEGKGLIPILVALQ